MLGNVSAKPPPRGSGPAMPANGLVDRHGQPRLDFPHIPYSPAGGVRDISAVVGSGHAHRSCSGVEDSKQARFCGPRSFTLMVTRPRINPRPQPLPLREPAPLIEGPRLLSLLETAQLCNVTRATLWN